MKITNDVLYTEIINIKTGQDTMLKKLDEVSCLTNTNKVDIAKMKVKQNIMWGIIASVGVIVGGAITTLYLKVLGGK
jgi:hypothetical protein